MKTDRRQFRLQVLELADEIGNVAEACRRFGVNRTSFYAWKRRYEREGLAGLDDHRPVRRAHPQQTPRDVVQRICEIAMAHPDLGCNRLEKLLAQEGHHVSAVTVQKILNRHGLGARRDRWVALANQYGSNFGALSDEQLRFLERLNPAVRERSDESGRPGECLTLGTFYSGRSGTTGAVLLTCVVDTYCSLAFGQFCTGRDGACAVDLLDRTVLPFFRKQGLPVQRVVLAGGMAPNHRGEKPTLAAFLESQGIEIELRDSGFFLRFRAEVLREFVAERLRTMNDDSLDRMQAEFDDWLEYYNSQRSCIGYRNYGRPPLDVLYDYHKAFDD